MFPPSCSNRYFVRHGLHLRAKVCGLNNVQTSMKTYLKESDVVVLQITLASVYILYYLYVTWLQLQRAK